MQIAREYKLFLVADEIYINMVYNGKECTPISEVVEEVPAIALKGISKEFPWPGGRCGWMEVYNHHKDPMFELYIQSILNAKMLEVSSTTLPLCGFVLTCSATDQPCPCSTLWCTRTPRTPPLVSLPIVMPIPVRRAAAHGAGGGTDSGGKGREATCDSWAHYCGGR